MEILRMLPPSESKIGRQSEMGWQWRWHQYPQIWFPSVASCNWGHDAKIWVGKRCDWVDCIHSFYMFTLTWSDRTVFLSCPHAITSSAEGGHLCPCHHCFRCCTKKRPCWLGGSISSAILWCPSYPPHSFPGPPKWSLHGLSWEVWGELRALARVQFANYPGSLGSKQRSSIWSCRSRVQRYWHCTKSLSILSCKYSYYISWHMFHRDKNILGLRADSASIPPVVPAVSWLCTGHLAVW